MFKLLQVFTAIGLILSCLLNTPAQETAATCSTSSLYGRVTTSMPDMPLPQSWSVKVSAKPIGGTKVLDSEESQGEMYCVKVPLFSKVILFFEVGGYEPQFTDEIDTNKARKKHSFALPIMKLDPMTGSQIAPDAQRIKQARQDIHQKLVRHKEALSATGSNDIFTWNLALYRNLYSNQPEVLDEINKFETELKALPEFLYLSTSEFEQKSQLFEFIIAWNRGKPVGREVRLADIAALAVDSRIFSGIRLDAISVLDSLSKSLSTVQRDQISAALIKVVDEDASSTVRAVAAKALTQVGNQNALDVLRRASLDDEDPEVRRAANDAHLAITLRQMRPSLTPIHKAVPNPDGMYTVIEYPAKKEVKIRLTPINTAATGVASILRDDDGTRIKLNLTNVPADVTALTLYAIDDTGTVTALGPVAIANGTGELAVTTPLSKFMLVASPEPALTAYDINTRLLFRSAVPEGFAVIPLTKPPEGEKVSAVAAPSTTPSRKFDLPLLNIPAYKKGDDIKLKVDFEGALTGARANVFITPRKDGPTEVKVRFHTLRDAPAGQSFVLWAVSPDGRFVKLGEIVNIPVGKEAEIKSETTLPDFGLLMTMETAGNTELSPAGPLVAVVHVIP